MRRLGQAGHRGTPERGSRRVQVTADRGARRRDVGLGVDLCTDVHGEGAAGSEATSHLTGHDLAYLTTQDDPFPFLLGADIFVLPSHADPAPLVLSEAREAGCAIVATNVDGIPELLEHGKAGILVPARSSARLAEVLCTLVEDAEALQTWKQRSQFNLEHLRIERVARQTVEVYATAQSQLKGQPFNRSRVVRYTNDQKS